MVSIGNADQVMVLVRSQLQRMARDKRTTSRPKADGPGNKANASATPFEAMRTLRDVPDREFDRLVVRALLSDDLGQALIDDAEFLAIAHRTLEIMRADPELGRQLETLRHSLRGDLSG